MLPEDVVTLVHSHVFQKTENSILLIPRRQIPIEEAYTCFVGALSAAAHGAIPTGVRRLYKPLD